MEVVWLLPRSAKNMPLAAERWLSTDHCCSHSSSPSAVPEEQWRVAPKTLTSCLLLPSYPWHSNWEGMSLSPQQGLQDRKHHIMTLLPLPHHWLQVSLPGPPSLPAQKHATFSAAVQVLETFQRVQQVLCPFSLGSNQHQEGLTSTNFAGEKSVFLVPTSSSYPGGISQAMLAALHPNNHPVMTPAWWTKTSAEGLWVETTVWKQVADKNLPIIMRLCKRGLIFFYGNEALGWHPKTFISKSER